MIRVLEIRNWYYIKWYEEKKSWAVANKLIAIIAYNTKYEYEPNVIAIIHESSP